VIIADNNRRINEELVWVQENIVKKGLLKIPEDFHHTAAAQYDKSMSMQNQREFSPSYVHNQFGN